MTSNVNATKLVTVSTQGMFGSTNNFNGMVDGGNSDYFSNCVTTSSSTYCGNFWFRNYGATAQDFPVMSFPLTVRWRGPG